MPSLAVIEQQLKEKHRKGTLCPLGVYFTKKPRLKKVSEASFADLSLGVMKNPKYSNIG